MLRKQTKDNFRVYSMLPTGEYDGPDGAGGGIPPVVKTPEQIQVEITSAMNDEEPVISETPDVPTPDVPTPDVPLTPTPVVSPVVPDTSFKPNPIWDRIKSSYEKDLGEGKFVMPEGLTSDNEYDKVVEFLRNNVEPDISGYHPFVQEVLSAASEDDFDPDNFINAKVSAKTYWNLASNEFLKRHLMALSERDKKGWTEENIQKHIDSKDPIQLDAEVTALKTEYKNYEQNILDQRDKENITKRENEFTEMQDKRNKDITSLIERNKSINDFYGVKLGEADLKEFHKWLPDMLTVKKETGSYPLLDYMRSDDNLMRIAAIVYKTEKGMRDYLFELKEGVKTDLMSKLRLTPNNDGGSIVSQGIAEFDSKKLED